MQQYIKSCLTMLHLKDLWIWFKQLEIFLYVLWVYKMFTTWIFDELFNCQSLRQSWIPLNLCLHFASLEKGGWIKTVLLLSKYLSYNCTSFSQNDKSPSSQNVNFQNIHFQLEIPFHSPNVFTLIIFKFSSGIFRSMTLKRSIRNGRNARFQKIDVESV